MRIENGVSNNSMIATSSSNGIRHQSEITKNNDIRVSESYQSLAHKPHTELTMDEKQWINLIEKANKAINGGSRSFEFSIHEANKEIVVKVIDKDTNEVIREIPNEKILDMVAKMWEMSGIFVDERR